MREPNERLADLFDAWAEDFKKPIVEDLADKYQQNQILNEVKELI